MNEALAVFLNLDANKSTENNTFIERIDELLRKSGMKYTGFSNMYRPVETRDRDAAVFAACRLLKETDWLKDKLADISIINRLDVCSMDRIRFGDMSEPSAAKLGYYENYYQKSHKLAHGIVVDEHGQMRDGYISYLIAQKYGLHPDIYEAFSEQPLTKIVRGRHISREGDAWKIKSDKIYTWNYSLKAPVVPGDILKVQTQKGKAFMGVDEVHYLTGKDFCQEHRSAIKHMQVCKQEPV